MILFIFLNASDDFNDRQKLHIFCAFKAWCDENTFTVNNFLLLLQWLRGIGVRPWGQFEDLHKNLKKIFLENSSFKALRLIFKKFK